MLSCLIPMRFIVDNFIILKKYDLFIRYCLQSPFDIYLIKPVSIRKTLGLHLIQSEYIALYVV
jgi:hypothetical protein